MPTAIIIGSGFGGLAGGMILSSKGFKVTVVEKLDIVGGRGSARFQDGHRFDLGPTILTVPKVFEELWERCGADFHKHVKIKKLDPYYNIIFQDKTVLKISDSMEDFEKQIKLISPKDLNGYRRFMDLSKRQYEFAFSERGKMGRSAMHRFWDTLKVFPTFARLRADRSVFQSVASYVSDSRLRFAMSFHPLFVGGDPFKVTSMWGLVNYLEHKFGVHYVIGGAHAMAGAMAKKN
jgi:phytoene desaturase